MHSISQDKECYGPVTIAYSAKGEGKKIPQTKSSGGDESDIGGRSISLAPFAAPAPGKGIRIR
jgi:hypothetical protein